MQHTHHRVCVFLILLKNKSFKFSSFIALAAVDDVLFVRQLYLVYEQRPLRSHGCRPGSKISPFKNLTADKKKRQCHYSSMKTSLLTNVNLIGQLASLQLVSCR